MTVSILRHSPNLLLFLLVLVGNHWWLGRLLSPTGHLDDFAMRLIIWCTQSFLLILGVVSWRMSGSRGAKAKCLLFVVSTFLAFVFLLVGVQIIGNLRTQEPDTAISRAALPQFAELPWAEEYWREFSQRGRRFRPYYLWRSRKYKGKYINIDSQGVRKTWNPEPGKQPLNIWFLGGSTTWGSGARDDYTIPSQVSRMLNEDGINAQVTNFGETGYVFSQEIIYLMEALRLHDAPDLVVFYDGANDVYAPYQSGYPGVFQNYQRFLDATNLIRRRQRYSFVQTLYLDFTDALQKHCYLYKIINAMPDKMSVTEHEKQVEMDFPDKPEHIQFQEAGAHKTKDELDDLSKRSASVYLSYADLLDGLSKGYGFEYALLWQPLSFYEGNVFDQERTENRMEDPALKYFALSLRSYLRKEKIENFYDISDALQKRSEPTYFDFCHITETGNARMAREIINVLMPMINRRLQTQSEEQQEGLKDGYVSEFKKTLQP